MAAIEALNDYFVKVKLDRVEEDSSVSLYPQTNRQSIRRGSDDSIYSQQDEEDGEMHISLLNLDPGLPTTYSPTSVDFSQNNSHSTFSASPSLPSPYSPASSPHLSVLSATSTLHPLSQSQFSHSPILDVSSELDSLSDYFASPVQSLRSSPISTPTLSAPFAQSSSGRKTHQRARTVSSSITRPDSGFGTSFEGVPRVGGRSMSTSEEEKRREELLEQLMDGFSTSQDIVWKWCCVDSLVVIC